MTDVSEIAALGALVLTAAAVFGVGRKVWRWAVPKIQERRRKAREKDIALLGRPAIPANPVTGEPAQEEIPSMRQQVAEIHHETHNNDGSSIKDAVGRIEKRLDTEVGAINGRLADGDQRFTDIAGQLTQIVDHLTRIEGQVAGELAVSNGALANAAEASRTGLRVIEKAIDADPPVDLD